MRIDQRNAMDSASATPPLAPCKTPISPTASSCRFPEDLNLAAYLGLTATVATSGGSGSSESPVLARWLYTSAFYRTIHFTFNATVIAGAILVLFLAGFASPGEDLQGYPRSRDIGFLVAAFFLFIALYIPVGLLFSDRLRVDDARGWGFSLSTAVKGCFGRREQAGTTRAEWRGEKAGPPMIGPLPGIDDGPGYASVPSDEPYDPADC